MQGNRDRKILILEKYLFNVILSPDESFKTPTSTGRTSIKVPRRYKSDDGKEGRVTAWGFRATCSGPFLKSKKEKG